MRTKLTSRKVSLRNVLFVLFISFAILIGLLSNIPDMWISPGRLTQQIRAGIGSCLPEYFYRAPVRRYRQVNTSTWWIPAQPGVLYNSTCNQLSLSQTHLPSTALATFPGSGNTWARYLIQEITGYLTGSQYRDLSLERRGFPGEVWTDGKVVAVKTHDLGTRHRARYKFTRAILVIRDPYDALIAEYHRLGSDHVGTRNKSHFAGRDWTSYVDRESFRYYRFHKDWLTFNGMKLVIRYEEMQKNLSKVLKSFCSFLTSKRPCTDNLLECVLQNSSGSFKRTQTRVREKHDYEQYFTASNRRAIELYKENVDIMVESCVRKKLCVKM